MAKAKSQQPVQMTYSSGRWAFSRPESDEPIRALRDGFERLHHVRLPGLLSAQALQQLDEHMELGEFTPRTHAGISTELCMESGMAPHVLTFLTNDRDFFEFISAVTGCGAISAFVGRIYRMMPGPAHEDSWHSDLVEGDVARLVAMSINLSDAPYRGGELEIRDKTRKVFPGVANTGRGDAVIFRIAPGFQHRVGMVEGEVPRTAYAGWFVSDPKSERYESFLAAPSRIRDRAVGQ